MTEKKKREVPPAVTIFESEGLNAAGDPFLSVMLRPRPTGPYVFSHRGGKNSVAFVLWDSVKDQIGLLKEDKPPLGEFVVGAFGGSLDKWGVGRIDVVREELREEAGFTVTRGIVHVGRYHASTQSDEIVDCYLIEVDRDAQGERDLDADESESEVIWISPAAYFATREALRDWRAEIILASIYPKERL